MGVIRLNLLALQPHVNLTYQLLMKVDQVGTYGALMENSDCQQKPDIMYFEKNLPPVLLLSTTKMFLGLYTGPCSKGRAGNYLKCGIVYLISKTIIQC
jgi:hypothetical protein